MAEAGDAERTSPVEIINRTPFTVAPLPGRLGFPGHSLTLIAKASFAIRAGEAAATLEEQGFPTGDTPYADDEEGRLGPCYESDFAPWKPAADLLLVGHCHTPGGEPMARCDVAFQVGDRTARLAVFGRRHWNLGGLRPSMSEPEPFTRQGLRYEHAFGGPDYPANPTGVGHGAGRLAGPSGEHALRLPRIEHPDRLIRTPADDPGPAGFGPLARGWAGRCGRLGTYDSAWQRQRWPWYPDDFDWRHWNAAPLGLQQQGYLEGNERLVLTHLHPQWPQLETRLPGIRLRFFVTRRGESSHAGGVPPLEPVDTVLDTLWVDADAGRVVLVWRGWCPVADPDASDLLHIYLDAEQAAAAPGALPAFQQRFTERLAEIEAEWAFDEEAPPPPEAPVAEVPGGDGAPAPPEPEEQKMSAAVERLLALKSDEPEPPPFEPAEDADDKLRQAMARLADLQAAAGVPEPERARLPETEPEPAEASDQNRAGWSRARVAERLAGGGGLTGEDLSSLDLRGLELAGAELEGVLLDRSDLRDTSLARAVLRSASLRETRLDGSDLTGCDLVAADLTGATAAGALLVRADLTDAIVSEAGLPDAMLAGAILEGSDLTRADLSRANLREARLGSAEFTEARLEGALMDGVRGPDAMFLDAALAGASLRRADLPEAWFAGADLSGCDLSGAHMPGVILESVRAPGIDLRGAEVPGLRAADGADFSGAQLGGLHADGSIWEGANLSDAQFAYARLAAADFSGACLQRADLRCCNAPEARFIGADLSDAKLQHINLFRGSLERANLARVDVSGANLYGAEFLDSQREGLHGRDVNLIMTKLAGQ